jgi:GT2 family glycosyltransferase
MPHEIIVVDDASSDASADIASHYCCCVVRLDENIGAARAKNRGAHIATGDILLFTDDDVLLEPDAVAHVARDLEDPHVAAVVGLLARETGLPDFASNYKNLWMRFTYARLPRERIGVFYTSIAAIRRELFLQLGGFDENYTGASIAEDTEFGQRVWAAGHLIRLDPDIVGTHRKHYTQVQVLRTDFLRARALVLIRLRKWGAQFYTSVPLFYQFAVPIVYAAILSLVLGVLLNSPAWLFLFVLWLVLFYVLHSSWLLFLARERGARFALLAALFQPLDVMAVGMGMVSATFDFVRGKRY